ncbi:TATA element modulatory factor [Schizosaccharomyces cryophilus OY26]|uniref:TATA element modulatory factor n=1 Tax=Schizosaccharomyces cryophilus (strain OY26 / ATCC MYA-4695 / CBS 11777 / NBRC 106824 / NRRL Y48691) TaxID=653667 RepID=S9X3H0_SCHCR|nr:TATA element modulatory factor [Schizosaccharomyces cryophilus OY26]EPY51652.1 TATA element modulatory factor [Schizosaccharomyces cryophilus OY26]
MEGSKWGDFFKKTLTNVESSLDKVLEVPSHEGGSSEAPKSKDEVIRKLVEEGHALSKHELKLNNTIKNLRKNLNEAESKLKRLEVAKSRETSDTNDDSEVNVQERLGSIKNDYENRIVLLEKENELLKRKVEEATVDSMEVVRLTRQVETLSTQQSIQKSQWLRSEEKLKAEVEFLNENNRKLAQAAQEESKTANEKLSGFTEKEEDYKKQLKSQKDEIENLLKSNSDIRQEYQLKIQLLQQELESTAVKAPTETFPDTSETLDTNYTNEDDGFYANDDDDNEHTPTNVSKPNLANNWNDIDKEKQNIDSRSDINTTSSNLNRNRSPSLELKEENLNEESGFFPKDDFIQDSEVTKQEVLENYLDTLAISPTEPKAPRLPRTVSEGKRMGRQSSSRFASMNSMVMSPMSASHDFDALSSLSYTPSNGEKPANNTGPDMSLLEQLSSTIRRLEAELQTTKQQIVQLINQRDQARQEIVNSYVDRETKEASERELIELRELYTNLQKKHVETQTTLKQRSDRVFELELDIKEMRQLYQSQIDLLARN